MDRCSLLRHSLSSISADVSNYSAAYNYVNVRPSILINLNNLRSISVISQLTHSDDIFNPQTLKFSPSKYSLWFLRHSKSYNKIEPSYFDEHCLSTRTCPVPLRVAMGAWEGEPQVHEDPEEVS